MKLFLNKNTLELNQYFKKKKTQNLKRTNKYSEATAVFTSAPVI